MARAGGLNVAGAVIGSVGGFLLTGAMTNVMTPAQAGTVFATTTAFLIVVAITQLGTESGMVRWLPAKIATDRVDQVPAILRAGLVPVLLISATAAALIWWQAPLFARLAVRGHDLDEVAAQVRMLAPFIPVAAGLNVVLAATRGFRDMRPTVVVESLGRSLLQLLTVVGALWLGARGVGVVFGWAIPYLVALIGGLAWLAVLIRRVRRRVRSASGTSGMESERLPVAAGHRSPWREFWGFTAPRAIATTSQTLLKRSDIVLVAALRSPAEAALYTAATRFVTLGQIGVQAIQQALAPQLSAMFAKGQTEQAQDVYQTATAWSMMVAWPIYITCAVLAPTVLLFFGSGYAQASTVVILLSLAMLLAVASGAVDTVLLMSGRSGLSLLNMAVALGLNIGLNLVLIPRMGITGAGLSWMISIVVRNVLTVYQVRRYLRMGPVGPATVRVAIAATLSFGLLPSVMMIFGASQWVVAVLLVAGLPGYAAILWRSRNLLHLSTFKQVLRRRSGSKATKPS